MHRAARIALVLALCAGFGAPRLARADALPVDLSWDAPPECPSHDEVMAELARITRVKPDRVVTPIVARAKIERVNERYRLHLRTQRDDQTGDTDLDAPSCPVLKRGVTLVLALALGDGVDLVDEKSPPPEPPVVKPPPAPVVQEPVVVPAPVVVAESAPFRWSPWLAATAAWGLNARPSLGAQLGLELGATHWQTLLQVSVYPSASADRVQGIDSSYSAFVGAAGGCARLPLREWALAACATLEVGAIRGSSSGAYQDGAATAPWYAVGPTLLASAPLYGRLKLRAALSLAVAFDPPHFAIRQLQDVYVVSRAVPSASLGLSF